MPVDAPARNLPLSALLAAACGFAFLFSGLTAATPPDWTTRVWEADDGLLDNRVTGLTQSEDGMLWVSTLGGVLRFNGSTFEEFHLSAIKGVIGNGARGMYADSHHHLWLSAFRESLIAVRADSATVYDGANGIPAGSLNGLAESKDGTIWLAMGSVLGRLEGGQFRELIVSGISLPSGRAALCLDASGQVWGALNGRIGLLEPNAFAERYHLEHHEVVLAPARAGGLWASANNKILKLAEESPPVVGAALPADARPLCLLEDRTGVVWIGTLAHGLYRLDELGLHAVTVSHQQVNSLLEDREGNIWAGTFGGGLNRLRPRAIELLGIPSGLPETSITSLCQDINGVYWAATVNGHLVSGDGTTWTPEPLGERWPGYSAACVAADREGRLWVGTRGQGLLEINLRTGQRRTWLMADGLPDNSIRALLIAADNSLWFSSNGRPGSLSNLSAGKLRTLTVPPTIRNIRSLVQDANGQVWAGTSDGQVLRVSGDALVPDAGLADAIPTSVRSLHATADGSLWISYAAQAIAHYKQGKYRLFANKQSLVPDIISQFASDRTGALWLAGSHGLYQLPAAAVTALVDGRNLKPNTIYYGRSEGVPNLQPHYDNSPTVVRGRDDRLLFSTSLGVLALNPDNLRDHPVAPRVVIETVTVDDQLAAIRDRHFPLREESLLPAADLSAASLTLQLPPSHLRLAVEFAALSFTAPENVRYRYRLAGFDEAWSEAGNDRLARYSRLPAGDYRFEVMASNAAGLWSEKSSTLAITVSPFIWQTWWFRVGLLGLFTTAIVMLVRFVSFRRLQARLRRTEQQMAVSHERSRIARDIHDDLGGSLAHIKLLSEIAIQDSHSAVSTESHLRQITSTTQQVLKSLDETIWSINPRNDTLPHLVSYLGQYAVEFLRAAGIACEVDLPENPPEMPLTPEIRHHVFLTVKEALTNVVRHSAARQVRLQLTIQGRSLRVVIQDDGRGFVPQPAAPESDGLSNMRQRLAAVGGLIQFESTPGTGTKISLELELKSPL